MRGTLIAACAAALLLAPHSQAPAEASDYTLRFIGTLPTTHDYTKTVLAAIERIEERSDGRLDIRWSYFGETPYSVNDALTLVRDGLADVVEWLPANNAATYPIFAAPELVFMSPNYVDAGTMQEATNKAWETPTVAAALVDVIGQHNGIALARFYYQPMNFWFTDPVRSKEDLKDKRIRTFSPEFAEFLEELGAAPVNMSAPDVYTSLQRNVLDGVVTGSGNLSGSKWDEVLRAGYITNLALIGARIVIAEATLERLPEDLRELVVEEMAAVEAEIQGYMPESDTAARQALVGDGFEIVEASQEDYQSYRTLAATHVWTAWKERVGPGADEILEEVQRAFGE